MKLNQLRYFIAVCKHGSFAGASKAMFITQPAIAQAVRDLETEFGLRLFERYNNNLTITEDGKWLYEKALALVDHADDLEKDLHSRANKNSVKLGIAPMFGNLYLYEKVNAYRKQNPQISFSVEECGSLAMRKLLEHNNVDLGVCVLCDLPSNEFNTQKLLDVELKFCVQKGHPLSTKKSLTFSDLANVKICLLKEDSYQNFFVQKQFDDAGVPLEIMMYSSQLSSITTMLRSSDCGAFLLDSDLYRDDIVSISMNPKIYLPLGVAWKSDQPLSKQAERIKQYFCECFDVK